MSSLVRIMTWPFSGIFSPRKASLPPVQPMPQAPTDTAAKTAMEEAAKKQRLASQLARGRASTLLTGGEGVMGKAPVKLKELFGE